MQKWLQIQRKELRRHELGCVNNADNVNFNEEERREEIEEIREKIKRLEEELKKKEDFRKTGTVGFSNHLKHAGPNDDLTTLSIALSPLATLSLEVQRDQHVSDVRRRVAQHLNKPLESVRLLNFYHREMLDGETMRTHGIGGRDHQLLVLPENRVIPPGMAVKIKIIGTRPAGENTQDPRTRGGFQVVGTQHYIGRGRSSQRPGEM